MKKHTPATTTLYSESRAQSRPHRAAMLKQVRHLIAAEQRQAQARRKKFFNPPLTSLAAFERATPAYRQQLRAMLGWPLVNRSNDKTCSHGALSPCPKVREVPVSEDRLGKISRLWIKTLPGLDTYGMLFVPHRKGPHPLVISQHGGWGSPELCSGLLGPSNYNDMTRRVLRRGFAVFAPQLLLWNPAEKNQPKFDHARIDRQLKQLGGSLAALELFRLQRCLDALTARPDIQPGRIGMIGLSYGGFYTLFAAALDPRIRVAVSSCFFNNRTKYDFPDWTWFDSANKFLDAEIASLVCPRPLYLEVAKRDQLFDVRPARPEARRVAALYRRLGVAHHFCYHEHCGTHELDKHTAPIDFLETHLKKIRTR